MQELSWEVKTGGTCMVTVVQSYIWLCMQLASPAVDTETECRSRNAVSFQC